VHIASYYQYCIDSVLITNTVWSVCRGLLNVQILTTCDFLFVFVSSMCVCAVMVITVFVGCRGNDTVMGKFRGVNLFPTLWGSKVPPFPYRHLSFPPIRLPSAPLLFPLPLEVAPLIQVGGLGSEAPAANDFGAFWGWRNAAGGIQDARFQTTERLFLTLTTNLLWGSGPADSHGIDAYGEIAIFMVNRENSMVVPRGWPIIYGYPWQRQKKALLR